MPQPWKVIQYISQDLYILCHKYLRFSLNGFDVIGKSRGGGSGGGGRGGRGGGGGGGGTNWKHKVIPDRGDLIEKFNHKEKWLFGGIYEPPNVECDDIINNLVNTLNTQ